RETMEWGTGTGAVHVRRHHTDPHPHHRLGRGRPPRRPRRRTGGPHRGPRHVRRPATARGHPRPRRVSRDLAAVLRLAGPGRPLRHPPPPHHGRYGRRVRSCPAPVRHSRGVRRTPHPPTAAHIRSAQGTGPVAGRARTPLVPARLTWSGG